MKILFIYPSYDPSYPLQLGALSAFIKQEDHESRLLSLIVSNGIKRTHYAQLRKEIKDFKPDFVGFSCYETAFPWIKKLSTSVKKNNSKIKIIAGGYHATLAPEEVISYPAIDIVCRGEGELALSELLKNPRNTKIKNLWFKKGKKIIKNEVRPLIENLDKLPFPDRDMLDYQGQINFEKKGERNIKVMASRGCPYFCTYCSNKYFKSIYPNKNKYLRLRSPKNEIKEIKLLKSKYDFDTVGFHDDNLTLDKKWLKEFATLYKKEIKLPFYAATRVEYCTDEILKILKKAGCYLLLIGVESGDEKYRSSMMKRYMTNKVTIEAFHRARKIGLQTWSFTMVGLPMENRRMLLRTLWLNWRAKPDFVMASIFYPLIGTELGDLCYANHWVNKKKKEKITSYAWESILDHPILTATEIRLAKYLNSFTAIRSSLFWKIVYLRLFNMFLGKGRI